MVIVGRRVVFDGIERRVEESVPLTDRHGQGVEPGAAAGREVDRQRSAGGLAPRVEIAQPDEVEVVVGVHVPDDDAREVVRVEDPLQVADHALADIEQEHGCRVPFDQVPGGRCGQVGRGRRAAEHGQTEARARGIHAMYGACAGPGPIDVRAVGWPTARRMRPCWAPDRSSHLSPRSRSSARSTPRPSNGCASGMRSRRFRRGEVIFHIGDPGDALFVIVSGDVKISLPSETGDEAILATLRPGDVFGELALLDGAPRSASASALTPTETVILPRDKFRELIATEAGVRDALLASIAGELRRLTTHVEELHFLDITGRLAARLVRLAAGRRGTGGGWLDPPCARTSPRRTWRPWSAARARA